MISIKGPSVNLNKPIWTTAAHLDIEYDIVNQRPHDKAHMEVGSSQWLPIHLTAVGFQVLTVTLCLDDVMKHPASGGDLLMVFLELIAS